MNAARGRRRLAVMTGAVLLLAAGGAFAQSYPMLADDPVEFLPVLAPVAPPQALGDISAGVVLEYVTIAADHEVELLWQDGPRATVFIEYQATGCLAAGASIGYRTAPLESSEIAIEFGELAQIPLLAYVKLTPSQPIFGTGRTDEEVIFEPFVIMAGGLHMYAYDSNGPLNLTRYGGSSRAEVTDFGWSPAFEARIGAQLRIPPGITVGLSIGYLWTGPGITIMPVDKRDNFNGSTYVYGLHGELPIF